MYLIYVTFSMSYPLILKLKSELLIVVLEEKLTESVFCIYKIRHKFSNDAVIEFR